MKKIPLAKTRTHNACNQRKRNIKPIANDRPEGRLVDLDTLDTETRRAVQVVLHRMSREGRRALIHAANVEAVMDLPTGYMTNPWALPFFDDPLYRNDGHHAFYDLVEASTNTGIQPTTGRLHTLLGAMRAGRA